MPSFNYTTVRGISPIPVVCIYFQNPLNSKLSTVFDCAILDTGSDISVISFGIISKLQLKPVSNQKYVPFRGLGGEIQGIPYRIKLSFDNQNYFNAKVIAVPDDVLNGEVIIGRNILNRYCITFDGRQGVFTID